MGGSEFDIYQTADGYAAVTNPTRRQILEALARRDMQLPELMKLTKKAKPTLSSVHMRELLDGGLVAELPHPTDKRKKIYRLTARRIGSSDVPVDQLRSAVQHYVALSPLAARLPITVALDAIASAPAGVATEALREQARRLGELSSSLFAQEERRGLVTALAQFLEREGIARPLRLDLEALALDLELGAALPEAAGEERLAHLVAGLVEGVLRARGVARGSVRVEAHARRRVTIRLPGE